MNYCNVVISLCEMVCGLARALRNGTTETTDRWHTFGHRKQLAAAWKNLGAAGALEVGLSIHHLAERDDCIMARYFKFKSPDEVAAEAASLGYDLKLSADLSALFHPIAIGRLSAGNRLLIQPMEGCDGMLDGQPDELTF